MGNPSWGHGYHEGYGDGARQGSALTAAAVVVVGGAIVGAKWSYNKLRQRRTTEYEQSTLVEPESAVGGESVTGRDDEVAAQ